MEKHVGPRQAEHFSQVRSLPVSATRRRFCGGVPMEIAAKYWPEPMAAPEIRGDLTE